jgi:hypothetical protein
MTAWVTDMFQNCYLVKNHKITFTMSTIKGGKNKDRFGIVRILEFFDVCWAEF